MFIASEMKGMYAGSIFVGNGCGDYYCYHADSDGAIDETAIYIWEHEESSWKPVASGIAELITRYYHDEI